MLPAESAGNLCRQPGSSLPEQLSTAGRAGLLVPVILLLLSCAPGPAAEQACSGRQIVVEFSPGVDAALPVTAASLSHAAGVTVVYMRHLFDRFSLYCAGSETEPPVTEAMLQQLRNRIDVLSVETDAARHPVREN